MLYPLQALYDTLFPPTKHGLLLRNVSRERFISWYQPVPVGTTMTLSTYQLPEVQAAIAACKFEQSYHAARLLSVLVTTYLQSLPPKPTLLIPIPLHKKRLHKRGFNQVERVLRYSSPIPYSTVICTSLLTRTKHTPPQTSVANKTERLQNMRDAFHLNMSQAFYLDDIERVIICDDVLTTGATLTAAITTLTPALPKTTELITLTWSH